MRTIAFIAAFLLLQPVVFAGERTIDHILAQREQTRPVYALKTTMLSALVVNMSYGNDDVISETDRKALREAQVVSVDLVFSDFPKGLDMKSLNKGRIAKLYALRKDLVTNPDIQWRIIRQTSCKNEAEAKVLFHGIVVHYRPQQSKETIEADIALLNGLPATGEKLEKMVTKEHPYGLPLTDSTIVKVLQRNKEWKDMLIVADMTGSMSPYTTQLLIWFQLKMKDERVKQVAFFNDGDMKPDSEKKIGSTGGIYMADEMTYENILKTAGKTIMSGGGGDGPENNCEALIKSIAKAPGAGEVILIADNLAPVKDVVLAGEITRPVRIIVCGTEFAPVSPQYLDLARITGGSVHTMRDDLTKLSELNEGETVKIGSTEYKLVKGVFVKIVKS